MHLVDQNRQSVPTDPRSIGEPTIRFQSCVEFKCTGWEDIFSKFQLSRWHHFTDFEEDGDGNIKFIMNKTV